MTYLVSDSQLATLRSYAYRGLKDDVEIWTKTNVETDYGKEESYTYVSTVKGWLLMTNSPKLGEAAPHLDSQVGVFRVFLPRDSVVDVGDRIKAYGNFYTVNDTNSDDTWSVFLSLIVRRIE